MEILDEDFWFLFLVELFGLVKMDVGAVEWVFDGFCGSVDLDEGVLVVKLVGVLRVVEVVNGFCFLLRFFRLKDSLLLDFFNEMVEVGVNLMVV